MRPSRTIAIAAIAGGAAIALGIAAVAGVRSLAPSSDRGSCQTTKSVVATTVASLKPRFDVAELTYECRGNLAAIVYDRARIAVTTRADARSRGQLVASVQRAMRSAGWTSPAGTRRLTLRRDAGDYSATVTASSIAPALAIVRLANARPSNDDAASPVKRIVAERRLSDAQRLRYVTVSAFVPSRVPRGYAAWGAPDVLDYDEAESVLRGGKDVSPSLRSLARPRDWSARECDVFLALSQSDRCVLWGTTRSGIRVRIARDDSTPDGLGETPTALVDGTVVALLHGHNQPNVVPPLRRASVLAIFDSLRAVNTPARR